MNTDRRISYDAALSKSYWAWRSNPALSVPTMMASSLGIIAEVILGIFGIAYLSSNEGNSLLTRLIQDLMSGNLGRLSDARSVVMSSGFYIPLLTFMIPAMIMTLVAEVLASGFVYSAEFGSYQRALEGNRVDIPSVMVEFRKRWRPMASTYFLSYFITFAPILCFGLAALGMTLAGVSSVLFSSVLLLFGVLGTAAVAALLIYTPVVVCAEDLRGWRAVSKSASAVISHPGPSLAYSVVYLLLTSAVSGVASLVPGLNLPLASLASVGILIIVTPVLHLSKSSLFRQISGGEQIDQVWPTPLQNDLGWSLARMLLSKLRTGLGQLVSYTTDRRNFSYHIVASAALVTGLIGGITLGRGGVDQLIFSLGYSPGQINPVVTGSLPLTLGVYIFLHNWQVSLATALSGVWMSVIPVGTLFLNGVIIGVVYTLVPNTLMLAAALLPHGVIEVPSFIIAGSAGLKLGITYFRALRSQEAGQGQDMLGRVATQTVYVVVGLALLFLIAGLIEGNVTPWLMRLAGWS
ncbi:MAG: stage II sporulation protein M [Nitrososphaerota archaeon]|jgi:uncharacterized membrane protein SpoIIM required for sporulation|nr:stage II sporulation protein M [Nitrososphaerota archaeon]